MEIEAVDPTPAPSPKRSAVRRNIGHLPEHLPRIERVIEPESTLCPCGCGEMVRIGEDRSERLDIVPAQLWVIVTVRPKYAFRVCEQGVVQAPAPARLIEGAVAHVLISKYADHCPLHRQAQIHARSGLDLDRSTLAGWVGKASFHLRPLAGRLAEHLKRSGKLFMDETRAPVLDPGRDKTKTGWLWALARDDRAWGGTDPPGVVYFYAPGRGGDPGDLPGLPVDGVFARFMRRITPGADLAYWNASTPHPPSLNGGFTPPVLSRTSSVGTSASDFATASCSQVTGGRTVAYRNTEASFQLLE